jgi:hypothetical protein
VARTLILRANIRLILAVLPLLSARLQDVLNSSTCIPSAHVGFFTHGFLGAAA